MQSAAIYTLGCKLNQAESAMLAEEFARRGFRVVPFGRPADVVLVNTCTVTQRTDACARQAVRRALRECPEAVIVVAGCYAQRAPDEVACIPGVDLVLGADAKFQLFDHLGKGKKRAFPLVVVAGEKREFVAPCPGYAGQRTRAFLKVQDGCNARCSYCAVPLARGPARSAEPEDVLSRAGELARRGYREVVLTGVHVGCYGRDLGKDIDLAVLLDRLCVALPNVRIRLSSLECTEVTPPLVGVIRRHRQICRHFHIPLQSGSDAILESMRRPYTAEDFLVCVEELHRHFPEASIGTDVIVGYPGETEEDFARTVSILTKAPVTYLHVFRYSRRPETLAAHLHDNVSPQVKEQRSTVLRALSSQRRMAFARQFLGQTLPVLFERHADGWAMGLSDNYLRVRVPAEGAWLKNTVAPVRIEALEDDGTLTGHADVLSSNQERTPELKLAMATTL
ncbi:MAG: tRNA (N(6)-L-threonylcarbamoyladenosine(37)-C(2))-methylthiotransferase MtaB [candidate division KSB1 bacterium]|nr:tRNA (N(6)-L-threonylcarbamoyladenosine(37)-C(2))-methylthiotransferase MtaB [candidate division KSB1 bacterium]